MKLQFEGDVSEFCSLIEPNDPEINQELVDRNNLLIEAIHLVAHARGVNVNLDNFIGQLQCLVKALENEKTSRVKFQELAYKTMNFIDRQLGGMTTEDKFNQRLKELEAHIRSRSECPPACPATNSEDYKYEHRTDESQTASEGADTPAYVFESGVDPL